MRTIIAWDDRDHILPSKCPLFSRTKKNTKTGITVDGAKVPAEVCNSIGIV
jgi:hypothetical protein